MTIPPLTPQGTVRVPIATLTQLLASGRRIVGVSITPTTHEVASVGPPSYQLAAVLSSGGMLTPEELKVLVDQQQAGALVLGGSGLFRADGSTHFGVRKLISAVLGVTHHPGQALPTPNHAARPLPFQPWSQQQLQQQQQQHQQQQQQQWGPGPQQRYQLPLQPPLNHHHHHVAQRYPPGGPSFSGQPYSAYEQQQQAQRPQHVVTPILLCRENVDDASLMITRYIKRHSSMAFPSNERWTSAF